MRLGVSFVCVVSVAGRSRVFTRSGECDQWSSCFSCRLLGFNGIGTACIVSRAGRISSDVASEPRL